jgi:hypothetical protein
MEVGTQWSVIGGIVGQRMSDAAGGGKNQADKGIATQTKTDDFPGNGMFLSGEGESDGSGTIKVSVCVIDCKDTMKANIERDIAQSKGCVLSSGSGIFTGPTEEEECDAEHV